MRRKIWEHKDLQCAIVGTCLSMKELRKISRQTGVRLDPSAKDFEVHGVIVGLCKEHGPTAKAVNKLLDKKYSGALRRFASSLDSTALRGLWRAAANEGDIPGPFWAVMSHPNADVRLLSEVFGEVHMLSHLVGAANRADIRRLAQMEQRAAEAEARYATTCAAFRQRVRGLARANRELERNARELTRDLERERERQTASSPLVLELENEGLRMAMATQSHQLLDQRNERRELEKQFAAVERRRLLLEDELREKDAELSFLEEELRRLTEQEATSCPLGCAEAGACACPGPDLCGKRILYVGGRMHLVQHYRALVERHGGEFLHHDGGVEETNHALPRLLCNVDAVLCPVDCVSHNACQAVKSVCRRCQRNVQFLRSSGLSSLVRGLAELGQERAWPLESRSEERA